MGKNRSVNTFESVSWKIAHGYGRGVGLDYIPWISGHEFASRVAFIRLKGRTVPFPHLVDEVESHFSLAPGSAICVFKSLIRQGIIQVDLTKPLNMLNPRQPLERSVSDGRYRSYC